MVGSAMGGSASAVKTSESANKKRVKIIPGEYKNTDSPTIWLTVVKRVRCALCVFPEPLQIREIPVEIDMKATTPHEVLK